MDRNAETIDLGDGRYIGLESDGDELIALTATDMEDQNEVLLGLTISEAEQLIAALAVKIAQSKLAQR